MGTCWVKNEQKATQHTLNIQLRWLLDDLLSTEAPVYKGLDLHIHQVAIHELEKMAWTWKIKKILILTQMI